ncbi:MAG: L-histidine N(alpha)-methyltransferase [Chromatiales bacterium]|nr:L-histidine N(alpha)-methyltransferase [Chromatiales bacterium]
MSDPKFHDLHPKAASLARAVREGFAKSPKQIPPKFFYDENGSQLFDQICELPEYYITRTERRLLREYADEIAAAVGDDVTLVEPGAGSAEKVRLILGQVRPKSYVAVDISGDYLQGAILTLASDFPWLDVHGVCADFSMGLTIPKQLSSGRRVVFFPGSSLGNFEPGHALRFLEDVHQFIAPDGALIIGVDTKKDPQILHDAYNDHAGITAEFNLNLLRRIRTELDSDIDPESFEHRAHYNDVVGRIEMHLVSREPQTVRINGDQYRFDAGEAIHTESSYKYSTREFAQMARKAGLHLINQWQDEDGLFALYHLVCAA